MANKLRNIFDRGVYVGKNTAQAASVEFVHDSEQIMLAADCRTLAESPEGDFRHDKWVAVTEVTATQITYCVV